MKAMKQVVPGDGVPLFTTNREMLEAIPKDTMASLDSPAEGSSVNVIMSGSDMRGQTGDAEIVTIEFSQGFYWIKHPYWQESEAHFSTENEAIAEAGEELRRRNKGKWNSVKDAATYSGEERRPPDLICPVCKIPLLPAELGKYLNVKKWGCNGCKNKFVVTDRLHGILESPRDSLKAAALDAGFTEQQADFLWKKFDQ